MDHQFNFFAKEDALEGLRDGDYDPEKQQIPNFFFTKQKLCSIGMLKRMAHDMLTLSETNIY